MSSPVLHLYLLSWSIWAVRTECHYVGLADNINLISHSSGDGKVQDKGLTDSVSGEPTFWFINCHLLSVSSHGRECEGSLS